MCHHTIPARLKYTVLNERARDVGELLRLSEAYASQSAAVYGALIGIVHCEVCASAVLIRVFRAVRIPERESPKLHQLLRDTFACLCEATPEAECAELKARIHAWFVEGRERPPAATMIHEREVSGERLSAG